MHAALMMCLASFRVFRRRIPDLRGPHDSLAVAAAGDTVLSRCAALGSVQLNAVVLSEIGCRAIPRAALVRGVNSKVESRADDGALHHMLPPARGLSRTRCSVARNAHAGRLA